MTKDLEYYMYKRSIIPEIIKLYSNTPRIHYYSFAELFSDDLIKDGKCSFKIFFDIKPTKYFKKLFNANYSMYIRYSDCVYLRLKGEKTDILYRKRIYPFGELFLHIFIDTNLISLYVNSFYYSVFKMRVENVLPPGIHLKDFTYLKLLLNDFLPFYASSFASDENDGSLIIAPPNVGKSLTVMKAVENGFYFLSEDISIVNMKNLNIHAIPYTSTFYHETTKRKYLGPLGYFFPTMDVKKVGEHFINRGLLTSKLKQIFILENGKTKLFSKGNKITDILNINKYKFNYRSNIVINALLYNWGINLEEIEYSKYSELINKIDVIKIIADSPVKYFNIIKGYLNDK